MGYTLEKLKAEEEAAVKAFTGPSTEPEEVHEDPGTQELEETQEELEAQEEMEDIITGTDEPEQQRQQRTNWKKRFVNFKASADATIFDLRTQVANLKGELAATRDGYLKLQKQLESLQSSEDPWKEAFTEEDEATFGADGLAVVKKATQTAIEKATAPLKEKLAKAEQASIEALKREAQAEQQASYGRFIDQLGKMVPDFKKIDVNPEFLKWMQQPDTFSGITRAKLFRSAEENRDAARVADFFVEFKSSRTPSEAQKHITPVGNGASTGVRPQATKKNTEVIYTSEIDKFYGDVLKGLYAGRHDEVLAIEAQIDKAMQEGRIRKG